MVIYVHTCVYIYAYAVSHDYNYIILYLYVYTQLSTPQPTRGPLPLSVASRKGCSGSIHDTPPEMAM